MRQSKKANEIQETIESLGYQWHGWDDDSKKWRVIDLSKQGELSARTLAGILEVVKNRATTEAKPERKRWPLPTHEVLNESKLAPLIVDESDSTYVAKKGDAVTIDRGTDSEIQGVVREVVGSRVTVYATKVTIFGKRRPDLDGMAFFPEQNGQPTPWGLTDSLRKA